MSCGMLQQAVAVVVNLIYSQRRLAIPHHVLSSSAYPKLTAEELLNLAIRNYISRLTSRPTIAQDESFFVADLGQVVRQHQRWTQNLPGVRPFYGTSPPRDPSLANYQNDLMIRSSKMQLRSNPPKTPCRSRHRLRLRLDRRNASSSQPRRRSGSNSLRESVQSSRVACVCAKSPHSENDV